jgi:hypothetical protein
MTSLNLKTSSPDISVFKKIVANGISGERKKIEYALNKSLEIIQKYEKEYNMSSEDFSQRFHKNEIEESGATFEWWAELKVARELEEKLKLVDSIEICQ